MLTAVEVEALFQVNDTTRCPIIAYEIAQSDESGVATTDDLYSRLDLANAANNAVKIQTNVPA